MSEIRFIDAQGDLLESAIAQAPAPSRVTLLSRVRSFVQPHKRLTIVLVALLVAGCAAVAATSLTGSTERLALGRVNCYYGTTVNPVGGGKGSDALDTGATLVGGETPQSWCRQAFKGYSARELRSGGLTPVRDPKLLACRMSATTIAVVFASRKADQCQHLGLTPLPKTTTAAFATVHSLGTALRKLYFSRNCWSAPAFARAVRKILVRDGLARWRISPPQLKQYKGASPADTGGDCAVFVFPNPYAGNPYQSLDGPNRSFTFGLGMSHSDYELWNRLENKLASETSRRCYRGAAARELVSRAFAGTGLTPRIAITTNPNHGERFAPGASERQFFQSGCVIQPETWLATNDRFADVWLISRRGKSIKFGTYPPPASYFKS